MTERAIDKMVEWLEEWQADYKKGPCSDVAHCLRKAKILALEEAKEKPPAPASVEYPCPTCGAERFKTERRLNGDSWCRYGHKHPTNDFVRPSTQTDIVGELKEWFDSWPGHQSIPTDEIQKIITKHEGGQMTKTKRCEDCKHFDGRDKIMGLPMVWCWVASNPIRVGTLPCGMYIRKWWKFWRSK